MLRKAAVAGTWYPDTDAHLRAVVDTHLRHADVTAALPPPDDAALIGLIAPHAGMVYSGPVAAHAYRLLRQRAYELIVLIGPSHFVPFEGVSIWPTGWFETPLGNLPVDEAAGQALMDACRFVKPLPSAHEREHSLEMQLPFLGALAAGTPILPLVMGHQTRQTAYELADALVTTIVDRRVLLVASSDLSHYYDALTAARMDAVVVEEVEELDSDGLMHQLEKRPEHACGGGPIVSVMRAARALGATTGRVLRYADSGEISGDKTAVVGYLAAAFWR